MNRYVLYLALTMLALGSHNASAQSTSDRAGTWDFGIFAMDQSSETLSGEQGSTLDIAGRLGWGITALYNANDHLAVGIDFAWNRPNYAATRIVENPAGENTIRSKLDMFSYELKGVFHFIDGPFTPFVEASAGWTNMDSNIPDGPPTSGCWWDPWWGYICDSNFSTYSKTRFSYGGAAGLRFDMRNGIGIKGSYGIKEIDTSNATESATFDIWKLELLWQF
jgi:opacity protein-like surface antigen